MMRALLAVALAGCCAGPLSAAGAETFGIHTAADIELDFDAVMQDKTHLVQGGRARAVVQAEHRRGDFFMRARGEALLRRNGETGRDDAYLQFGSSRWDIQLGRFEAWDLGPKGKDTVVNDVRGSHYLGNAARGRAEHGQTALHFHATEKIGFELAALYGSSRRLAATRGSIRLHPGAAIVTAGIEHDRIAGRYGMAITATLKRETTVLNLSLAHRNGSAAASTLGANLVHGPLGVGLLHTRFDAAGLRGTETTAYTGYTVNLPALGNSTVTFGASHSLAGGGMHDMTDKTTARVRFVILF